MRNNYKKKVIITIPYRLFLSLGLYFNKKKQSKQSDFYRTFLHSHFFVKKKTPTKISYRYTSQFINLFSTGIIFVHDRLFHHLACKKYSSQLAQVKLSRGYIHSKYPYMESLFLLREAIKNCYVTDSRLAHPEKIFQIYHYFATQ